METPSSAHAAMRDVGLKKVRPRERVASSSSSSSSSRGRAVVVVRPS